jgi:hypothetical protein
MAPVAIEIARPDGFITVPVPAGSHTVRVWLGSTPARTSSTALSLLALAAMSLTALRLPVVAGDAAPLHLTSVRTPVAVLLGFVLTALAGGSTHLFQPVSTGLTAAPADQTIHAYLQGGIDLIGYSLPSSAVRSGDPLPVELYWKASEPVAANYQVFVHLTSIPEHTWGQSDKLNPGDYHHPLAPRSLCPDPHLDGHDRARRPANIRYSLSCGSPDRIRQLVLDADGAVLGDSIPLPDSVTVLPAARQPDMAELPLDVTTGQHIAPGIELIGADIEPGLEFEAEAGRLYIILYWRLADLPSTVPRDESWVGLRLVSPDGAVVAEQVTVPVDGRFPFTEWTPAQIVRDVHSFWLDSAVLPGEYSVEVAWSDSAVIEADEWVLLASIRRP